jgi:NAD(P)-dependent dehydrogenase (short-subunit alcohol dehydrogenase family)
MTLHSTDDLKLVDGDIGIEETAKHVVRTAIQNFGTVDLLVNNAGVFIPKPFTDYTAAPGDYSITVAGSSAAVSHSTDLQLAVTQ